MKTLVILGEMTTAVEGPPQGSWTYDDWETLGADDENRYEIIDGFLYMTTAPKNFHQWIISRLMRYVGFPAEDQGHYWFAAPIGVIMAGATAVQPDFLLILKENIGIIHDGRIRGVPDLIVEVLSPGSKYYDEGVKLQAYANAGVPEYVVIDPASRKLLLYTLREAGRFSEAQEFSGDDIVRFACLLSVEFRLSALFEGAPDTTV